MGITKLPLEPGNFLLFIRSIAAGAANRYITVIILVLLLSSGKFAKANTKVLATLLLGEIGLFANVLQGIKLKLLIVLFTFT